MGNIQNIAFFLLIAAATINAQSTAPSTSRSIPMGDAAGAIGTLGPEAEDWRPLFFAVDKDNNLYIPDYYKNRIAVYRADGAFDRGIAVKAGISPRIRRRSARLPPRAWPAP
jgi:hypothetical protein